MTKTNSGVRLNNGTVVRTTEDIRDATRKNDEKIIAILREEGTLTEDQIAREIASRERWLEHNVKVHCQRCGIRYQKPTSDR